MPNPFHLGGVEALNNGDYQKAINLFLQAISRDSKELRSHLCLGQAYFLSAQAEKAIPHLKKYIQANTHLSNTAYPLDLLGQCYAACNNPSLALDSYRASVALYPKTASVWHNMGMIYIDQARINVDEHPDISVTQLKEAEECIKEALDTRGTFPMFLNSWASVHDYYAQAYDGLFQQSNIVAGDIEAHFKLAVASYKNALERCHADDNALRAIIESNLSECLAQYGHYLYRAKEYTQAKKIYLQAIVFDPEYFTVISQLAN